MKVIYSMPVCDEMDKMLRIAKAAGRGVEKIILTPKEWKKFMYEIYGKVYSDQNCEKLKPYCGITVVKGKQ